MKLNPLCQFVFHGWLTLFIKVFMIDSSKKCNHWLGFEVQSLCVIEQ